MTLLPIINPFASITEYYTTLKGGSVVDISRNSIPLTVVGAVTDIGINGEVNGSYYFNGSSYIYVNSTSNNKLRTSFVVNFWIKPDSLGVFSRPFNSENHTASGTTPWVRCSLTADDELYFGVGSNNTNISITGGVITGEWQMITLKCVGNGTSSTIEAFIDGVSIGTASGTHTNINTNMYMCTGALKYNTTSYLNPYSGKISEVSIFHSSIIDGELNYLKELRGRVSLC